VTQEKDRRISIVRET